MFWVVVAFLVVVGVLMFVPGCNEIGAGTPNKAAILPTLPAGNQAPSKAFLEQWDDFVKLRDEIKDIQKRDGIQEKVDQLNGMGTRLQSQIPTGFSWDEDTKSFKPIVPPTVTPPPTPPVAPAKK
jgi:hypothetical protein